ncbi:MAG: hypothetical protein WEE20_09250 [Bacteroidota bacterium]
MVYETRRRISGARGFPFIANGNSQLTQFRKFARGVVEFNG